MARPPHSTKVTSLSSGSSSKLSSSSKTYMGVPLRRRVMPSHISHSFKGVSPMTAPTSSVASLRYQNDLNQSSYHNRTGPKTKAVMLAQDFFSVYDYDADMDEVCSVEEDDSYSGSYRLKEDSEPYTFPQLELALETNEELEVRLKNDISRFENAYNKMAIAAVKWKQLMEDVEDNPQIKKMFKDMQLMRRLSGSDYE